MVVRRHPKAPDRLDQRPAFPESHAKSETSPTGVMPVRPSDSAGSKKRTVGFRNHPERPPQAPRRTQASVQRALPRRLVSAGLNQRVVGPQSRTTSGRTLSTARPGRPLGPPQGEIGSGCNRKQIGNGLGNASAAVYSRVVRGDAQMVKLRGIPSGGPYLYTCTVHACTRRSR